MIYVDTQREHRVGGRIWWCSHMMSDVGVDELHEFAARLGLKRNWFQDKPTHPHYDILGKTMYAKAIKLGATPVTGHELVRTMQPIYGNIVPPRVLAPIVGDDLL